MTDRIPGFEDLLAKQVEEDRQEKERLEQERKAKKKKTARNNRWLNNLSPTSKAKQESKSRVRSKKSFIGKKAQTQAMSSDTDTDTDTKRPASQAFGEYVREEAIRTAKRQETQDSITQGLLENQKGLLTTQAGLLKQQEEMRLEAVYQRRREEETRQALFLLMAEEKKTGGTAKAPEPVLVPGIDTPIRPRPASVTNTKDGVMATPHRNELRMPPKTPAKSSRTLFPPTIGEEADGDADTVAAANKLVTMALGEDSISIHETVIQVTNLQGLVQVLDCTVTLQGGTVVPVRFLNKIEPTMMKVVAANLTAQIARPKFQESTEGLASLMADGPISELMSHESFLLGKGVNKCYLWKYVEHSGTFVGPVSFPFQMDATTAIIQGAVVGFDVDLWSHKHYGILHQVRFTFDDSSGSIKTWPVEKLETRLPKNRVKAKIVADTNGTSIFALAEKKDGRISRGHMFVQGESDKQALGKLSGFSEGAVVDIAANKSHRFVLTGDGKVFYSFQQEWIEFKLKVDCDYESLKATTIGACDTRCVAISNSNSKAFFVFPTTEGGCEVITRNLDDKVEFLDGSNSFVSFLGYTNVGSDQDQKSNAGSDQDKNKNNENTGSV